MREPFPRRCAVWADPALAAAETHSWTCLTQMKQARAFLGLGINDMLDGSAVPACRIEEMGLGTEGEELDFCINDIGNGDLNGILNSSLYSDTLSIFQLVGSQLCDRGLQ